MSSVKSCQWLHIFCLTFSGAKPYPFSHTHTHRERHTHAHTQTHRERHTHLHAHTQRETRTRSLTWTQTHGHRSGQGPASRRWSQRLSERPISGVWSGVVTFQTGSVFISMAVVSDEKMCISAIPPLHACVSHTCYGS